MRWDGKGSAGGCGVQPLHAAVAQHHMMMGQTAGVRDEDGPMLLFTGISAIGVASGAGYRIAAVCAAVLCGIGGIVFAFYNERKVLNRLDG